MNEQASETAWPVPSEREAQRPKRVIVVSSDRDFAESLRSHLAGDFDVLLARDAGEAAAKTQAVPVDLALVDLGSPILGIPALVRMKAQSPTTVICALALPEAPANRPQFQFDYVLARPASGTDIPDRVRFILAKAGARATSE